MFWKHIGLCLFHVFFIAVSFGQQLQVQNFAADAYGNGAGISVPIRVTGCFGLANRFDMHLSDQNGDFTNATLIGSYDGFFTPFVNGIIPNGTPAGTGYKIRISSTQPATSVETNAFTISSTTIAPVANPLSSGSNTINDSTFGRCIIFSNQNLALLFSVPAAHTLGAQVYDSLGTAISATVTATQVQFTMIPGNHYTVKATIKNTADNTISTKSFLVYVSTNNLSLQTSGASDACLPDVKTYTVNVVGNGGIRTNYPGTRYIIEWGDGTSDTYSHCEMIAMDGLMSHNYVNTSCGMPPITDLSPTQYNAFRVNVMANNVFCQNSFTSITTYAKVWQKPEAEFTGPNFWCINQPVTFTNSSDAGLSGYNNVVNCIDQAQYEWYVDGQLVFGAGRDLTYTFTTAGYHTVRLVALNDPCSDDMERVICIEEPLVPDFKINNGDSITGCAPLTVTIQNNTEVSSNPCRPFPYSWSVLFRPAMTPAQAGTHYTIAPHDSAKNPTFQFLVPGEFVIRLTIANSCGDFTKDLPVTITDVANVTFDNAPMRYCGVQTIDFSQAPHRPNYNSNSGSETYNWLITGGSFTFLGGTNATSAYPQIQFNDLGTYNIQLQFNNDCGTQTANKTLIFDAPVSALALGDTAICNSVNSIQLSATASGPFTSASWSIVNGSGSFSDATSANPIYTFSSADKAAGSVTLRYNVNAAAGNVCGNATDDVVITILSEVLVTSSASMAICSGGQVAYLPQANTAASFSWISTIVSGNVTGNTPSGTGDIMDVLTNTSASVPAVVKYFITPSTPGCTGTTFELTVVVQPSPTLAIINGNDTICTGNTTNIEFLSSYTNSLYSWDVQVASGSVSGYSTQLTPSSIRVINDVLVNNGSSPAVVHYIIQLHTDSVICGGEKDTITIVVNPAVTAANAGADQLLCNQTVATLATTLPVVGNGTWTQVNGPAAVITNVNGANTTVTGLQPGATYTFVWTVEGSAPCAPSSDTVIIVNRPAVSPANAGTDQVVCAFNGTAGTVKLSATPVSAFETGLWSLLSGWPSGAAVVNPNDAVSAFTFTNSGTYTLVWSITNDAGCAPTSDTVVMHVFEAPDAGNLSPAVTEICRGSDVSLNVSGVKGTIVKWQYNTAPFADNTWKDTLVNTSSITFNNLVDSMMVRLVVQGDGSAFGCVIFDTSNTVLIHVAAPSVGGDTNADATVCSGANSGTINLTNYTGNIVGWESSTNGGLTWIALANTSASETYTNLTVTTWYRALVQNGSCAPAYSDTTIITVIPQVQQALAGNDQVICSSSAVLSANAPAPGEIGAWQQLAGPNTASLSSTTSNTIAASGLLAGSYSFAWTLSNGTCTASRDTVFITVRPAITQANAGGDAVVCDLSTGAVTLSANMNASRPFETGLWTIVAQPSGGNGSFSQVNNPQAVFSFSAKGIYTLVWTINNDAGCAPTNDTTRIIVFERPAVGTVTGVTSVCAGTDVTISLDSWNGNIRKWQYNPAPLNDNIWIDTLVTTGTIQFLGAMDSFAVRVVVQSEGIAYGCTEEVTSNIHIVNVAPGTVPGTTGPNATFCAGSNSGLINLTGHVGDVIRWEYSRNNGASWTPVSNTSTSISYVDLNATTWYRAVIQSASCGEINSSTTIITVLSPVTIANAGADLVTCTDNVSLAGNTPAALENVNWQQIGGPSPVSFSSVTTPSVNVSGLVAGTYHFVYTISNSVCVPSRDTVAVTVRPATTVASAGNDTVICNFVSNGTIILNGNRTPGRSYETSNWRIITQPATGNATFSDTADANAVFSFNAAGNYVLVYTISSDGGCSPTADTISIHVFDKPVAGTITGPSQVCAGSDVQVTLGSYTGIISRWQYNPAPIGDNIWIDTTATSSTITFMNVVDTIAVRVIVSSNGGALGCNGADTSNVLLVNVVPGTIPGTTASDATVCAGGNTGMVMLTGNTGAVLRWESSTNNGTSWTPIANTTQQLQYNNLDTTTWYRAVIESGNCGAVPSTATIITVADGISKPQAGTDQVLCNASSTVLSANFPAIGETGSWSQVGGAPVTFSANVIPTITISGMVAGTYTFVWTFSNGACPSRTDTVVVVNYPSITNIIDTAAQTICYSQPITINGQQPTGGNGSYTYQWQQSTNGSSWVNMSGETNQSLTYVPTGSVSVRRIVYAAPCESISDVVTITVQPPVGNNTISSHQDICINTQPALINGSLPTGATGMYNYQWQESTDGGASWLNIPGATGQHYQPGLLNVRTIYRRNVSSGLCSASQSNYSDSIVVNVNPDARAFFSFAKDTSCPVFVIDSSNISVTHFAGNGGYLWYANNNLVGTSAAFPGYSLSNSGDSVTIMLVAVSASGCVNDTMQHTFYAKMKPALAFAVSDSVGCGPLSVSFTNNTADAAYYQFHWNFGNGQVSNAFNPGNVVFMPNSTRSDTVYHVSLTVYSECDSMVIWQNIRVKAQPRAAFNPDKTFGCTPLTVSFTNLSAGSSDFTWDFGDGTTFNTLNTNDVQHTFISHVRDTFEVKLIARNDCGTDTARFSVIVSPNNIGLFVMVDATEQSGCAPHRVRLYNNTTGASNFVWDFADGNSLVTNRSNDTVEHVFDAPGVYRVRIAATNGCSDTSTIRTITVLGKPVVNFTATPMEVCVGEKINFRNLSDTITGSAWRFGDGNVSSLTHPTHSYNAAGIYTISLVGSRLYSSGNSCADSAVATVNVIANRPGSFSVSDSIGSCVPFTVTFTNNVQPSSLTTWNFGNGKRDTGNVVTHTFTSVGSFNVTMNATAPGGCLYNASKEINITGPAGSMNYEHGLVCGTRALRFETIATGADSVRWYFGDGTSAVSAPGIIYYTYSQPGSYVPFVELLSGGGCKMMLPGIDTIRIDKLSAGFTTAQQKECGSTKVMFTDTSKTFFGVQQWSWNFGDGGTSSSKNPEHAFTSANTWPVRLVVTTASGCRDTADMMVNVPVNNLPQASIIGDSLVCAETGINFRSSVVSADSISMYLWSFSNGTFGSGNTANTTFSHAGAYTATLVVSTYNGCRDTIVKNLAVNPTPVVTATGGRTICQGQPVQLNANGAMSYTWSNATTLSCSTCPNPLALTTASTTYEVTGVNAFGCTSRDTVQVIVAVPFTIEVTENDTVCFGQTIQLNASGADYYRWSPAQFLNRADVADPVASPLTRTAFRVVGFDSAGCFTDTAFVTISVGKVPTVSLGSDKVVAAGTLVPLTSTVTNGPIVKWQWTSDQNVSCLNCPEPMAHIKRDIAYSVKVANTMGCEASDTIQFKVFCEQSQVFIPNLFTPDGDGVNDLLMVRGKGIKSVKNFRIFNRWGEIVFEKANFEPNIKSHGWDGTVKGRKAPPDVYVYTCEVMCENDVPFVYKGNVAIIK